MRRVFLLEVIACACRGTRRVISSIEEGPAARKILQYLGLCSDVHRPASARIDEAEFFPTGPPSGEPYEPPPVDAYDQRLLPHLDPA